MDQSRVWKTIGDVARATGTKVQTVRYYEELGLLPPAPRSSGNQRLYDDAAQKRLSFIRHARDLGFSLEAVRDLLRLADHPEQPCAEADAIAARQLEAVNHRIDRLKSLRRELQHMVANCGGDSVAQCRVIETLDDHSLCIEADHLRV
jgi:Cu(I)-responsive transcriptional regulator